MAERKVATIVGVGPGLGAAVARRFGREGFAVALIARGEGSLTPILAQVMNRGRCHEANEWESLMSTILQPAIALVLWSLVMMLWMSVTRLSAFRKAKISLGSAVGGRGQDLEGVLPDVVQWKSHNYNHLMEQPTLFYAVVLVLAAVAPTDMWSVRLAWAYVGLRVMHSVYQATVNVVLVRSTIFTVYSFVLIALTLRATTLVY